MRFNSLYLENKLAPNLRFTKLNTSKPTVVKINIPVFKINVATNLRKPHPIYRSN